MKKTDTKAPFKLNILGFKLETTIKEMSFNFIVFNQRQNSFFIQFFSPNKIIHTGLFYLSK